MVRWWLQRSKTIEPLWGRRSKWGARRRSWMMARVGDSATVFLFQRRRTQGQKRRRIRVDDGG